MANIILNKIRNSDDIYAWFFLFPYLLMGKYEFEVEIKKWKFKFLKSTIK